MKVAVVKAGPGVTWPTATASRSSCTPELQEDLREVEPGAGAGRLIGGR